VEINKMDSEELIAEALQNIREDRQETADLLKELKVEIQSGETTHSRSGVVAAKYLETLQRSNEQMVKIVGIINKNKEKEVDVSLSSDEKENIFEAIREVV
jgi:hypothetical protein